MKWYTGGRSASTSKEARVLNRTLHSEGFRCCHRCFEIKPKTVEFFHIKCGEQLNSLCKPCAALKAREHKLAQKADPQSYCKRLCVGVKARAKEQGLDFDLTPEYLYELLEGQNFKCFYTGELLDFTVENGDTRSPHRNLPSLDKLTPSLGYTQGNVSWCLFHVNRAKSDLTFKEFIDLCQNITREWEAGSPRQKFSS